MNPHLSFEVFPPKTPDGLGTLVETVRDLARVDPAFVSMTYGAGGSDRERSFDAIETLRRTTTTPIAGHVTCVGQSRHEVESVIDRYEELGVRHVVALRGDPPAGIDAPYEPHPEGFASTAELVAAVKRRGDLTVSVSAYPERHPQSPTDDHDLDVLAAKVDAGADRAMTQMFFDNECFFAYRERVAARGIDIPIVPGIFPIHSIDAVVRFARRCGATVPDSLIRRFDDLDPAAARAVAVDVAAEQIRELAANGVEQVHLYTLNRSELALAVRERLSTLAAA